MVLVSRASIVASKPVMAAVVKHDDHHHVLLLSMEDHERVQAGASVDVDPRTFLIDMDGDE